MAFSEEKRTLSRKNGKYRYYLAPVFCATWLLLFYVATIPSFYSYPETKLIRDEYKYTDQFIGERAQAQLMGLATIGVKVAGSPANEITAVNYLLKEINKIKSASRSDLYNIDVDVQKASGDFRLNRLTINYSNVTNIAIKISSKRSESKSFLLINSHFDSEMGSPGAGDAGVMITIMLETLRVISISERPLKNAIIFLLNGAEETRLLGSHAFITQHEWAPFCKALINLDSAGSGGREVLFQTGPNHPWLMKYYSRSAPNPYATTLAEELFQNNYIPSDTDFRVFRDYGNIPGLDMAHTLNGYVYHTKYDTIANLERGTCQTTGDNILALAWALANADELQNTEAYSEGHTIFYDYLGWFMIFYTESTGIAINVTSSVCGLIAICVSVFMITKEKYIDSSKHVYMKFSIITAVQILTVSVAVGVTILIGVIVDAMGLTQSWYSEEWLVFGLYFCPMFFTLSMIPALYIHWTKKMTSLKLNDTIACFMHAHCIILIFICLLMTGLSIRSAFFPMIAIFFYTISVILSILAKFICKGRDYYICIHLLCQLLPFWFYTYLTFAFLKTFIPMQGRDGATSNPELFISGFSAIMSIHFAGFILPILHKFKKSKTFISIFGVLTIIFIIIAATPAGFPYKKDVSAQRYFVLHSNRIIHDMNGHVVKNNSGFYIQPEDTRYNSLDKSILKDASPDSWMEEECKQELICGLPLYYSNWQTERLYGRWIPSIPIKPIINTELHLQSRKTIGLTNVQYNFNLKSSDRFSVYIEPLHDFKVVNWSFDTTVLNNTYTYKPPYYIYYFNAKIDNSVQFWIQMQLNYSQLEGAAMRIGIVTHFLYHDEYYTDEFKDFIKSFPDWAYPATWTATFESWYF